MGTVNGSKSGWILQIIFFVRWLARGVQRTGHLVFSLWLVLVCSASVLVWLVQRCATPTLLLKENYKSRYYATVGGEMRKKMWLT